MRFSSRPSLFGSAFIRSFVSGIALCASIVIFSPQNAAAAADKAGRVVSIGGALTEIVYALGRQDDLVAVDTTSVYPPEALKDKPNVGYMRALSAEGVLATDPGLILMIEGAGPPDALELLEAAGVPIVTVAEEDSKEGILSKITTVGEALGDAEAANGLAQSVGSAMDRVAAKVGAIKGERKTILFLLSMQGGRLMVGGEDTQADAVIRLAGGVNAAAGLTGFKPMSNEAIVSANPDVILMMSGTGMVAPGADEIFSQPALSQTKAAKDKALILMPGMYLLGFGPRTPYALAELTERLYPGSFDESDPLLENMASQSVSEKQ
ncbi:ABC transporter substrate-binding protein [uncultured Cohaesibacter sp.]|uniref:heme/hemin ABC transporter substrate-binding protein n=1 Tax=uncultured Cohaesibacter sp. TaxID=1002546 RepID=UPI0029C69BCB|nr:ABC transporter substrate-binding protein [uncultured Cohaesibacter sp.]